MNQKSRKASQIKEFRLRARSAYPSKILMINFDQEIGDQIRVNKRPQFTFPNSYKELLDKNNIFPQRYEIRIAKNKLQGTLYKNPRPYYYFSILSKNIEVFYDFIKSREKFHVDIDLSNHILTIL